MTASEPPPRDDPPRASRDDPSGDPPRARLENPPEGTPRTTAALVASLRDRLATLRAVSGADAVGSLIAGYAAVGRDAARTAGGARLAQALRAGRPATNGEAVWTSLGVDELAAVRPTPVLDHLRNDLALLLADDLDAALAAAGSLQLQPSAATADDAEPAPADSVDYLVGLWSFSRELVAAVEALAAATARAAPVVESDTRPEPPDGPLLR